MLDAELIDDALIPETHRMRDLVEDLLLLARADEQQLARRPVGIPVPDDFALTEAPRPVPGPGEILVDVAATAVNRADLLQRQGFYPPPPGASDVIGLECSGTVAALGEGVTGWAVGDAVCALLAGGG